MVLNFPTMKKYIDLKCDIRYYLHFPSNELTSLECVLDNE